jgi:hypothetical protein
VAQATFSEREGFGAVGFAERRGVPVFAPRGFAYRPCAGDNLLLLEADGGPVCAGALVSADGLAPGEVRIDSGGGASVYLKENGDIVLNGVVITKQGEILPAV